MVGRGKRSGDFTPLTGGCTGDGADSLGGEAAGDRGAGPPGDRGEEDGVQVRGTYML
jgi:hypothetical protein